MTRMVIDERTLSPVFLDDYGPNRPDPGCTGCSDCASGDPLALRAECWGWDLRWCGTCGGTDPNCDCQEARD